MRKIFEGGWGKKRNCDLWRYTGLSFCLYRLSARRDDCLEIDVIWLMVLKLMGRIDKGTYEIEIEDLVIPSTRYPNHFSFLNISPYPSTLPDVSRRRHKNDIRDEERGHTS